MWVKILPFVLITFLIFPVSVLSRSGCCSGHGGVNCSAGAQSNGKVICNDGSRNSSCLYSEMAMCDGASTNVVQLKPIVTNQPKIYVPISTIKPTKIFMPTTIPTTIRLSPTSIPTMTVVQVNNIISKVSEKKESGGSVLGGFAVSSGLIYTGYKLVRKLIK